MAEIVVAILFHWVTVPALVGVAAYQWGVRRGRHQMFDRFERAGKTALALTATASVWLGTDREARGYRIHVLLGRREGK